jgi:hypothetical protein
MRLVTSRELCVRLGFWFLGGFLKPETEPDPDGALHTERNGLAGRPDCIVRQVVMNIPVASKASPRVYHSRRAQMGVFFLLIEEDTSPPALATPSSSRIPSRGS